jgi:CheY-like chemotaxis protein
VLLVDDHEEVRSATGGMLEDLGHEVTQLDNAPAALSALTSAKHNCDLLITDYAMPNLTGTDLVRQVRAHQTDLPAVIITGYADSEAIGDRPAGVVVLGKPFTLGQLAAAVGKASRK